MNKYIFHIGTNESLAFAEVGAVLGFESIVGVYKNYMLVEVKDELGQKFLDRMGSLISLFKVLDTGNVASLEFATNGIKEYLDPMDFESKICFAMSSNCLLAKDIESVLKNIKKNLKNSSISSRFILNVTAAAFKEAGDFGKNLFSFGLFKFDPRAEVVYLAEMVAIQDIDSYSLRDYGKPYRSAKLGMLPPKLAQTMVNLGAEAGVKGVVYDPFCGTGTVLMESMLMGYKAQGSDIQAVNIEGTSDNVKWITEKFQFAGISGEAGRIFELDATKIQANDLKGVDCIVTEGFLGVPKQGNESNQDLAAELEQLGNLYYSFLQAVSVAFKAAKLSRLPVVFTLPVYKGNGESAGKNYFIENLVEKLPALGYSTFALVPDNSVGLKSKPSVLYKRNDQKVFRQVIRLELKA